MFAFVTVVEPQFDRLNAARKGALKSHIFGAPKAGDRWNAPVLWFENPEDWQDPTKRHDLIAE